MGFATSVNIGAGHAVFKPSHGTAPDTAGQGKANPTSTILSVAVMLGWLGRRHQRGAKANLAPYNRARQADAAASMIESTSMLTAL